MSFSFKLVTPPLVWYDTEKRGVDEVERLGRDFYDRDTVTVARDLLGKHLVCTLWGEPVKLRITETEAYVGRMDRACHAYNYRRTKRTETLFAPPGTAYIYLIYGMHHCLNLVTEGEGEPAAVLLRAGDPVSPTDREVISRRRFGLSYGDLSPIQRKNLLNGPGKLCQGLGLTRAQDGMSLLGNTLYVLDAGERPPFCVGKRIAIDYAGEAADFPWRFYL